MRRQGFDFACGCTQRPLVESLEGRRLLSSSISVGPVRAKEGATAVVRRPHPTPSVPNLVGVFRGQLGVAGGGTITLTLDFVSQRARSVRGGFTEADGSAGAFSGSLARNNVLHLSFRGTNNHRHGTVTATLSGDNTSLTGTFVSVGRHGRRTGTLAVTRS